MGSFKQYPKQTSFFFSFFSPKTKVTIPPFYTICINFAYWLKKCFRKQGLPSTLISVFNTAVKFCDCMLFKGSLHPFAKGSLHPFALSFVSLETQSYFWMVMVYSLIFPWDWLLSDNMVHKIFIVSLPAVLFFSSLCHAISYQK